MAFESRRCARVLIGTLLLAGATAALAQDTTYVLVPSVPGESQDPNHFNWIEAYGLSTAGTSDGSPPPVLDAVHVLKGTDVATPLLHQHMAAGTTLGTVRVEVCRNPEGGGQECYYKLELTSSRVMSVELSGSSCIDPASSCTPSQTESVSFSFNKIIWVYVGTGKVSSTCGCWDVTAGKTCGCTP